MTPDDLIIPSLLRSWLIQSDDYIMEGKPLHGQSETTGNAKSTKRKPKSYLGRVFNCKLGSFAS